MFGGKDGQILLQFLDMDVCKHTNTFTCMQAYMLNTKFCLCDTYLQQGCKIFNSVFVHACVYVHVYVHTYKLCEYDRIFMWVCVYIHICRWLEWCLGFRCCVHAVPSNSF
jgi:hypothetical protein